MRSSRSNPSSDLSVGAVRACLLVVCSFMLLFGFNGAGFSPIFCAFFIMFSLFISGFRTLKATKKLSVRRSLESNRVFEHSYLPMRLTVENHSERHFLFSSIEDHFPPIGSGIQRQLIPIATPLLARKRYEIHTRYLCNNRRGAYVVGPVKARVFDAFAFNTVSRVESGIDDVHVYPRPALLDEFPFAAWPAPFSTGTTLGGDVGWGGDFLGIREYRSEDDPRHIHWPATARTGALMLREFEDAGATRITLFLDLCKASLAGIGHHTTAEYAVKIAATIAKAADDDGHVLQVFANGDAPVHQPFGRGDGHLEPLLHQLSLVKPTGTVPFDELIKRHVDQVPDQTCVVMTMSGKAVAEGRCDDAIELLTAKGVKLNLIIIDHTTFLPIFDPHGNSDEADVFQAPNENVRVFTVRKGDDLGTALNACALNRLAQY